VGRFDLAAEQFEAIDTPCHDGQVMASGAQTPGELRPET
jgi:hypothetical protein